MNTQQIQSLYLNIHDSVTVVLNMPFYYKLTEEKGKKSYEISRDKEDDDWIACSEFTGTYCGETYGPTSEELQCVKFRVSSPFEMAKIFRNYNAHSPSEIASISKVIVKDKKRSPLDMIDHILSFKVNVNLN